jgi:hypothetical protein
MKLILIALCILTTQIIGCQDSLHFDNKNEEVKRIEVLFHKDGRRFSKEILNRDSIQRIMIELEKAKRELAVFKGVITLIIIYHNKDRQLVLCNGSRIKVNGLTYKLNRPLSEVCSSFFRDNLLLN